MKTVINSREVAHVWANQSQAHARNSSVSVSFRDSVFYSYSTPIARIATNERGEKAFLITVIPYSVTTQGKHKNYVREAVRGRRAEHVFNVVSVGSGGRSADDFDAARELLGYAERIAEAEAAAKRSRKYKEYMLEQVAKLRAEAGAFAQFFGLADGYSPELIEQLKREAEHARAVRIAAARAQLETDIPRWRAREIHHIGSLNYSYYGVREGLGETGDLLRLSADGSEIETSRGASVPVTHARRLFCAWLAAAAVPGCDGLASLSGLRVGHYTVTKATDAGLEIGCHYISRSEAERLASDLGWLTVPA